MAASDHLQGQQFGGKDIAPDISLTPELKPTGPVWKHGEGQAGDPGGAGSAKKSKVWPPKVARWDEGGF
jgi:hypothetical protein